LSLCCRFAVATFVVGEEINGARAEGTKEVSEVYADAEVGDLVFCLFVAVSAGFGVCAVELHEVGGGVVQLLFYEGGEG